MYAWDIIPFTVPETKDGEIQEVFTHLLPNLQTDSAYVLNIKVNKNIRVRSFSRPEKLWLKIHTGSSGTVYSYWVESGGKALLFSNWSFEEKVGHFLPSPYVFNFRGFSLS